MRTAGASGKVAERVNRTNPKNLAISSDGVRILHATRQQEHGATGMSSLHSSDDWTAKSAQEPGVPVSEWRCPILQAADDGNPHAADVDDVPMPAVDSVSEDAEWWHRFAEAKSVGVASECVDGLSPTAPPKMWWANADTGKAIGEPTPAPYVPPPLTKPYGLHFSERLLMWGFIGVCVSALAVVMAGLLGLAWRVGSWAAGW